MAIRNAVLTYGLVNVPVGIDTAAASTSISFKGLHRDCNHPAKQFYRCEHCQVEVRPDDKVSGYQVAETIYVTFEKEELAGLKAERSPIISIEQFVRVAEIDPLYFDKHYFLSPPESALIAKGYKLLLRSMVKEKLAGVGRASLWGKEHPCAVYTEDGLLMFAHLFATSEIRDGSKQKGLLEAVTVSQAELKLGAELLRKQTVPFEPSKVESQTEIRLQEAIQERIEGKALLIQEPEPMPEPTVDLLAALRASMEAAEAPKPKKVKARA